MKKKEIKELITNSLPELKKRVENLEEEIKKIQIDRSTGKLKNTNLIGIKRRDVSRIKTIMNIKELNKK